MPEKGRDLVLCHVFCFEIASCYSRQTGAARKSSSGNRTAEYPSISAMFRVDSSMVEQHPFKLLVLGSNPSRPTMREAFSARFRHDIPHFDLGKTGRESSRYLTWSFAKAA